uniref:Small ribosomal subunit protein bS16m n=1 Tax=Ficedula albicollis TaxID=59894 RepID=A0A803W471_FICAL
MRFLPYVISTRRAGCAAAMVQLGECGGLPYVISKRRAGCAAAMVQLGSRLLRGRGGHVVIRFALGGCTNRPFFRIVAANSRRPRDGRYLEQLGCLDPLPNAYGEKVAGLNLERLRYWLGCGAQLSRPAEKLLGRPGAGWGAGGPVHSGSHRVSPGRAGGVPAAPPHDGDRRREAAPATTTRAAARGCTCGRLGRARNRHRPRGLTRPGREGLERPGTAASRGCTDPRTPPALSVLLAPLKCYLYTLHRPSAAFSRLFSVRVHCCQIGCIKDVLLL